MTFQLGLHVLELFEKAGEVTVQATNMTQGLIKTGSMFTDRCLVNAEHTNTIHECTILETITTGLSFDSKSIASY